jgi:glycerate dehydrogenase
MEIVVLDGHAENPGDLSWSGFEALGKLTVHARTAQELVTERIGNAGAVLVNKTRLTGETLAACPELRYIGLLSTGYDVVDVAAARERGIVVSNIPGYGTYAVGQFAVALLLEICCRVGHHARAVQEGRWAGSPDWCFWDYPLIELYGKTMGIIGFGRIGQVTGRAAGALGMRVLAYDVAPTESGRELAEYVSLDALLENSDVVVLHCALFPETRGIINKKSIAAMKQGVIIINNSRGQLIVEEDLAEALNAGKVYAAGLDVAASEPVSPDNPLLRAKNCFITPHISWAAAESRARLMNIAVSNLQAFLRGKPENIVAGCGLAL